MATPAGLEPATYPLGGDCSIQLSHGVTPAFWSICIDDATAGGAARRRGLRPCGGAAYQGVTPEVPEPTICADAIPFDGKPQMTLRDVAEAAGVSEMTVSRVLRQRGDVSEKTRERVFAAARTLGYVPNKIAGALASNRVNLVGVVIPSLSNMVFPDVLGGIGAVLDDTPLQPVVGTSKYDPDHEEHVIYEMLSWRPSGLIVAGLEHTDAARAMMANAGIPVVEVMDVDGDPVAAAVGISHETAGRDMAREIARRGYRKIAYLGSSSIADHRAQKRLKGFRDRSGRGGPDADRRMLLRRRLGLRHRAGDDRTGPDPPPGRPISSITTPTSTPPAGCSTASRRGSTSPGGSGSPASTPSRC
jgi:hypothetical protein